jgi:hypothetical protein
MPAWRAWKNCTGLAKLFGVDLLPHPSGTSCGPKEIWMDEASDTREVSIELSLDIEFESSGPL